MMSLPGLGLYVQGALVLTGDCSTKENFHPAEPRRILEKLEARSQKSDASIQKLQAENADLKQRLEKLEQLMNRENGGAR